MHYVSFVNDFCKLKPNFKKQHYFSTIRSTLIWPCSEVQIPLNHQYLYTSKVKFNRVLAILFLNTWIRSLIDLEKWPKIDQIWWQINSLVVISYMLSHNVYPSLRIQLYFFLKIQYGCLTLKVCLTWNLIKQSKKDIWLGKSLQRLKMFQ
jgi:hypothetical protein